ncbi:MAG TPA: glycosyltransferase family 39 protein [Anaerolineales bacterium]|nr:glycosyltransferase family 39 protein [Anaerolineales bacterium]
MSKAKEAVLILVLIALSAIPRFAGLGAFTSIDEPFWLRVSGNFYYALGQHQFQNTLYEYHPAVTTMWLIAAGLLAYFPAYRALGQGYLRPGKFDEFMLAQGKSLLQLLVVSRAIQVIVIIGLLLALYWLLRRLFGIRTAFLTTGLVSISPFFLGHSRLLNHEAMLALFLVISLVALVTYLHVQKSWWILAVSAIAAALGQLTKSSGIVLFPVIGLVILVAALQSRDRGLGRSLLDALRTLAVWLVIMAAAYVLFWPGMWVAPGKMLYEVYGNALTYMFQGARLSVTSNVEGGSLRAASLLNGLRIYWADLLWRLTPLSWIGYLLGIVFSLPRFKQPEQRSIAHLVIYAAILGLLPVLMFSAQRGPKPPHYALTTFVAIDLVAGLGWSRLVDLLARRVPQFQSSWLTGGAVGAILALQLVLAIGFYPYYITYYDPLVQVLRPGSPNPILRDTGYGVGLDRAAFYLAAKPGAQDMTVLSANGLGSFSYYFPGKTIAMNDLVLSDPLVLAALKDSQYVVVDYYNQRRHHLLADLQGIRPERSIRIDGIDFLHIYRAADILARFQASQP